MRLQSIALPALLLAALLLSASSAQALEPSRTISVYGHGIDIYGAKSAKRAIIFHGLSGSRQAFAADRPTSGLIYGLRKQGWQVIVPSLPYDTGAMQAPQLRARFKSDASRGASYAATFDHYLHAMLSKLDRRYGKPAQTVAGGISWGGFHAMLSTCMDSEITGYFAHSPVVDPRMLVEFNGLALDGLSLQYRCAGILARRQGFLSYGGADLRVGLAPITRLLSTLHARRARVASIEYPTLDHTTRPSDVAAVLHWTAGR